MPLLFFMSRGPKDRAHTKVNYGDGAHLLARLALPVPHNFSLNTARGIS